MADNVEQAYIAYEEMVQKWDETEVMYEEYMMDDAQYVIFAWGTSARVAKTAVKTLREEGKKVGLFRPITLLPFPKSQIAALSKNKIKAALAVEMAVPAQFYYEVKLHLNNDIPLGSYKRSGGYMVLDEDIADAMKKMM
jgi:2-oxoglutarate ferredoxin oxidoreductase subunit alpha